MKFNSYKTTKEIRILYINNKLYKIRITYEPRNNSRVSITKSGINIRIDNTIHIEEQETQVEKFIKWAKKTITEKNIVFNENRKKFEDGDVLNLYDKKMLIKIKDTSSLDVKGKIDNEKIIITISSTLGLEDRDYYISKVISNLIARNYKNKISKKLHDFNKIHHFGRINNIRLKNNKTNWGSCSSKNNINISIRLLLAPEWVVDYVLIHELSHLVHRNHSQSFWIEVAKAYPKYKEAEKWLNTNSKLCII